MPQYQKNAIAAVFLAIWAGFYYYYNDGAFTSTNCDYVEYEYRRHECKSYEYEQDYDYEVEIEVEEIDVDPIIYMCGGDPFNDIIQSIPSALEITALVKDQAPEYELNVLHDYELAPNYMSQNQRAITMGVYSTDLGYAYIHEKNYDALNYLDAINLLATGLQIEAHFDYKTIRSLVNQNDQSTDEILFAFTRNLEKANLHLTEQKRESLRVMMLTGAWVESMHMAGHVYQYHPSKHLKDKIGEQKIVVGQFLLLLDVYQNKPEFKELINDFLALQRVYDNVDIVTEFKEPEMIEKDGELCFVDKSVSDITINKQQIEKINQLVEGMREKLIDID